MRTMRRTDPPNHGAITWKAVLTEAVGAPIGSYPRTRQRSSRRACVGRVFGFHHCNQRRSGV